MTDASGETRGETDSGERRPWTPPYPEEVALFGAMLGPPIGGIIVWVLSWLRAVATGSVAMGDVLSYKILFVIPSAFLFAVGGFAIGFVPSIVPSVALAFATRRIRRRSTFVIGSTVSGVASGLGSTLIMNLGLASKADFDWSELLLLTIAGAATGAIIGFRIPPAPSP